MAMHRYAQRRGFLVGLGMRHHGVEHRHPALQTDEIVLAGPDEIRVTTGEKLAITVEGDQAVKDQLRFSIKDGSLAIHRKGEMFGSGSAIAIINVTMPAPKEVVMAGSGKITAANLANKANVTVAGSGTIETTAIAGESL